MRDGHKRIPCPRCLPQWTPGSQSIQAQQGTAKSGKGMCHAEGRGLARQSRGVVLAVRVPRSSAGWGSIAAAVTPSPPPPPACACGTPALRAPRTEGTEGGKQEEGRGGGGRGRRGVQRRKSGPVHRVRNDRGRGVGQGHRGERKHKAGVTASEVRAWRQSTSEGGHRKRSSTIRLSGPTWHVQRPAEQNALSAGRRMHQGEATTSHATWGPHTRTTRDCHALPFPSLPCPCSASHHPPPFSPCARGAP